MKRREWFTMSKRNSDWYIPPDWRLLLGLNFVPIIAIIAMLASAFLPLVAHLKNADMRALYGFGLGAGVMGVVLLFVARLPLYKRRRFWTIGPKQLDRNHRRIYWLAYILVLTSLLLVGMVWL
jgi:hypothetical protein